MSSKAVPDTLEQGFRLGRWRIEPQSGRIELPGWRPQSNHIEPRAMQVLLALAHRSGEFISKDELIDKVWADRVVTDDCLTRAIHSIRQALGDDPRAPEFIETRTNVGYRLLVHPLPRRNHRRRWSVGLAAAATMVVLFSLVAWPPRSPDQSIEEKIKTIAVLPFLHISDSPQESYLSLAMTEALITELAQQPGMQVISRTSVMSQDTTASNATTIARSLGADLLVEGSVQSSGHRVRVTAQLIDAERDDHLWASKFDRRLDDVFALQAEISQAITAQVSDVVNNNGKSEAPTLPALAMADFLHYRYLLAQESDMAVETALKGFDEITREHPDFAPAHLGKAQALLHLFKVTRRDQAALYEAHRAAVAYEALVGPSAESRRNLGQVVLLSEWDFKSAEEHYRDAIALNPSDTVARRRFAWLLVALQRYDEAAAEIDRIRLLDPLYYGAADIATLLLYAERVEESIVEFERLEAMTTLSFPVLRIMAIAYLQAGREADAQETLLRMLDSSGLLKPGERRRFAEVEIEAVYEHILAVRPFRSPIATAGFEQLLGRSDDAIDSLELAVDKRDPYVLYLDALPEFSGLREDPRFQALLARIGIVTQKQQLSDDLRLSSANLRVLQPPFRDGEGDIEQH